MVVLRQVTGAGITPTRPARAPKISAMPTNTTSTPKATSASDRKPVQLGDESATSSQNISPARAIVRTSAAQTETAPSATSCTTCPTISTNCSQTTSSSASAKLPRAAERPSDQMHRPSAVRPTICPAASTIADRRRCNGDSGQSVATASIICDKRRQHGRQRQDDRTSAIQRACSGGFSANSRAAPCGGFDDRVCSPDRTERLWRSSITAPLELGHAQPGDPDRHKGQDRQARHQLPVCGTRPDKARHQPCSSISGLTASSAQNSASRAP